VATPRINLDLETYTLPEYYDEFLPGVEGDAVFFAAEAQRAKGHVLELGAGTGRTLIPMAAAGCTVTGLDASDNMLARARQKLTKLPPKTRVRVTLVKGDMRAFKVNQKFALVTIPFRAFQHNLTVDEQLRCLLCVHAHLKPKGRLIVDVFDPSFRILLASEAPLGTPVVRLGEFKHPRSGHRVLVWSARRWNNFAEQTFSEDWIFEELNEAGREVARDVRTLTLRYTFRFEMEHLLARAGFDVEALHGDFKRGPFRHGGEQIWIARRA
jgi:SAM-dependent methyltransferase